MISDTMSMCSKIGIGGFTKVKTLVLINYYNENIFLN